MEVHSVEPLVRARLRPPDSVVLMPFHKTKLAVSYEGSMGLLTMLAAIPFLDHFYGRLPSGEGNLGYFDAKNGLREIFDNPPVLGSSFAIAFRQILLAAFPLSDLNLYLFFLLRSIAFFNYCGLAVTSSLSSTARCVPPSLFVRTL